MANLFQKHIPIQYAVGCGVVTLLISKNDPAHGIFRPDTARIAFIIFYKRICLVKVYWFNPSLCVTLDGQIIGKLVSALDVTRRC